MSRLLHSGSGRGKARVLQGGEARTEVSPEFLLGIFESAAKPLRTEELVARFGRSKLKKKILNVLADLLDQGRLLYLPGGRYSLPAALKQAVGRLLVQRGGMGFVSSPDPALRGKDIYISPGCLGLAWNGDLVRVALLPDRRGKNPEGIVLEVLERKQATMLVRVVRQTQLARGAEPGEVLSYPLDQRQARAILATVGDLKQEPLPGDILNVLPGEHLENGLWRAKALVNLGNGENVSVQEAVTKLSHSIPYEFPQAVVAEAAALPLEPSDDDWAESSGRVDLRHLDFVTIDGIRAKDFDDAVYVEKSGSIYTLYVAIADVTHYVTPGSALDREAQLRGNSYYFAQSVEPMLPEVLSNHLCSLRPGRNRLAITVKLRFSRQGTVAGPPEFCFSVIRSRARLSYDLVCRALEQENPIDRALLGELLPMLETARDLASVLQRQRKERGALFLDLPETEAVVDRTGKVTDIYIAPHYFAHQMIEEFMVAANEAVAAFLTRNRELFPYRVHPRPDGDKLTGLYRTLARSGLAKVPPKAGAEAIPRLLDQAHAQGSSYAVSNLVLRAMMQACYTSDLEPHFGLASPCYCHFTSPIRRYADVLVHRALRRALGGVRNEESGGKLTRRRVDKVLESINACEKQAKEAELELRKRLGVLFMLDKVGCEFSGRISGLNEFGIFVQLERTLIEGMVRLVSLGDSFVYLPDRQELVGEFSGKRFSLGREVVVRLVEVHLDSLEITFELVK